MRLSSTLVVWVDGLVGVCVCIKSSLHFRFAQLLRCAHKRIVNIINAYI